MNLLLDTNVVVDYLGKREPFYRDAQRIVAAGYFGDARLWMPAQSALDAFYILKQRAKSEDVQDALLSLFEVVVPVTPSVSDYAQAARLKWDDYEDCMVALCAIDAQAQFIVTRDKKGFSRSMVPAVSPAQMLATLEQDYGLVYDEVEF